jgi:hypothetical protein
MERRNRSSFPAGIALRARRLAPAAITITAGGREGFALQAHRGGWSSSIVRM